MAGQYRATTQADLLRQHEKAIASLNLRGAPIPQLGSPMVPASLAGSGVSLGPSGSVIFSSASSSIDIGGLFTADFEDYLCFVDIFSSSAACDIRAQLINAGGPYTAANYRWGLDKKDYSGGSAWTSAVGATILPNVGRSSGSGGGSSKFSVFSPFRTGAEVKMEGEIVDSVGMALFSAWCSSAVGAATGLRIAPSTGTISGAFRCFGVNKL